MHLLCSNYGDCVGEGADISCSGAAADEEAVEEEPVQVEAPTAEPIVADLTSVPDIEAQVPKEATGADGRKPVHFHVLILIGGP